MVLVRLRDAVDHRGRNRIVLHKRPARAIHAVTPNSLILRAPAEQLPNRRARSRDHIDAILGDTDGFHGREAVSRRLLHRHNRDHHFSAHTNVFRLNIHRLRRILLGGRRLRMPSNVLRMVQRRNAVQGRAAALGCDCEHEYGQ